MSENLLFLIILGIGILLLLKPKKDENGNEVDGVNGVNGIEGTKGHVTVEVIPVGAISHSSPEAYASVILKVTGLATHGIPAPTMALSLVIDGTLLPHQYSKIYTSVELAKEYYLEHPYEQTGNHTAHAFLKLSNDYGTFELKSGTIGFTIGQEPAGHITVGV